MNTQWIKSAVLGVLLFGTAIPMFAQAQGTHSGGGGNILKCLENGQVHWYLMDLWEAKAKGQVIELGGPNLSLEEKIEYAKARYAKKDPVRAEAYADEALKMLKDIREIEAGEKKIKRLVIMQGPLKDTEDGNEKYHFKSLYNGEEPVGDECAKGQLVEQEQPISPVDPFYTVDPRYWHQLDNDPDQQVATLFHEAIFKEFRSRGVLSSEAARDLNGLIMSGTLDSLTLRQYVEMIWKEGLGKFIFQNKFVFYNDGTTTSPDQAKDRVRSEKTGITSSLDLECYTFKGDELNEVIGSLARPFTREEDAFFVLTPSKLLSVNDRDAFFISSREHFSDLDQKYKGMEINIHGNYAEHGFNEKHFEMKEKDVDKFIMSHPEIPSYLVNPHWFLERFEFLSPGLYRFHLNQDNVRYAITVDDAGNISDQVKE